MSSVMIEENKKSATGPRCEEPQINLLSITESINKTGYAHIKSAISFEEFERISEKLGAIVYRTDLQISEGRASIVYKSEEIQFHMDNPNVHIIGWYCVRQDETDGSSLLIDTGDVEQRFSRAEIAVLHTINVRCPHPVLHNPDAGKEAFFQFPLFSRRGSLPQVYFANWHLLDSYDENQTATLNKFREYLRQKQERELISLRLGEKEVLFVNNRRLLHGRGQIGQNSSRLIKRVWITDPQDKW